jgi:hypothetical protein
MQVARVVWESLDGGGVADINILRVNARVEGDAEGMIQPSDELIYLCCLAIGPDATEHEQSAGTGVGEEEIAIGAVRMRRGMLKVLPLRAITCLLSALRIGQSRRQRRA